MGYIYYTKISKKYHDHLIHKYISHFPSSFQQKILKFRRWEDAQLSLLGRLMLKYGIKEIFGYDLDHTLSYTSYNKPYLVNYPHINFNISHSGQIAVCAITLDNEIGIDIELMKPINIMDFKNIMTGREWESIHNSGDTQIAFYKFWTQKEAVIKANGMGLAISLRTFEIINQKAFLNNSVFEVRELDIDSHYKCHIAFKNSLHYKILPLKLNHIPVIL
jgi:4'-phosphopantetheinyl transferase